MKRNTLKCALGALSLALLSPWGSALAQADRYPSRPITIVVGYPPGGSTDLTARLVGDALARELKATVVVENVGGAGGAIGAQKVLNAAPDGYTLLVGANNELAINRLISPTVKYHWEQFTPIGLIASQPLVLVATPRSGIKTTDEFIRQVKAKPGRFSYGSSGLGTALHLAGEMVKQQAGLHIVHVPYRGVGVLTSDLISGNVDFAFFVLSSGLPQIRGGKVFAIGTTAKTRSPVAPDIPALAEHPALKNTDLGTWFALMAPGGLPEPVQTKLRQALSNALKDPDLRTKLEAAGSTVVTNPVDMARFFKDETAKYQRIVDFAHIRQ